MRLKILITLLFGLALVNQAIAQELTKESHGAATIDETSPVRNKISKGTRIVISTSSPAKFRSCWLDNPPRLVVKFQSRNIQSNIDNEVIVNQGVIKRVTSSYYRRGRNRSLESLTFELLKKAPYEIWQEDNNIILDIQAPLKTEFLTGQTPLEISVFCIESKEIFTEGETDIIIKRLEAMDTALIQVTESQVPSEIPEAKIDKENPVEINKAEEVAILPKP